MVSEDILTYQLGGKSMLQSSLSGTVPFLKKAATNFHGTLTIGQDRCCPKPSYFALHYTPWR